MTDDDLFATPPRRSISIPARRQSCVVCNLRADCLICKECALRPKTSIAWLERLPSSERVEKGLELLRRME